MDAETLSALKLRIPTWVSSERNSTAGAGCPKTRILRSQPLIHLLFLAQSYDPNFIVYF